MHCSKNNLNICLKAEPVTAAADATVFLWFLCWISACLRGIFHAVSCLQLHFMLYRGNLDYFSDSGVFTF